MSLNYKKSGVNVDKADHLVDWIKKTSPKFPAQKNNIYSGVGGFSALFKINPKKYKNPLIVSSTDGIGTKVRLGTKAKDFYSLAQDLVAMCLNDLITSGADPLFFLDYYTTPSLDLKLSHEFLNGLRKSLEIFNCALIGGETAEHPGGELDFAGFVVGIVDQKKLYGSHRVKKGDAIIGIESSGFHSNGYSLLRQVFKKDLSKWKKKLLTPTHLYGPVVTDLKKVLGVKSFAHITGGGVLNIPRVIPKHLSANLKSWVWPSVFKEVQKRAALSDFEMLKSLNCGVGFVVICSQKEVNKVIKICNRNKFNAFTIGEVTKNQIGESVYLDGRYIG